MMDSQATNENITTSGIDLLIIEYIDGQISADDALRLEQWVSESDDNYAYARQIAATYTATEGACAESLFDAENGWKQFQAKVAPTEEKSSRFNSIKTWRTVWCSIAAALAIGIGICLYMLIPESTGTNNLISLYSDSGSSVRIVLPDKSVVTLNADTYLSYPPTYGKKSRDLYLNGEAYIEAAPNPKVPMIVHTGGLEVKVIGTTFNVRNYKEEAKAVVELERGKVSLATLQDTCIINPGDRAELNKRNGQLTIKYAGIKHDSDWRQSILRFENTPLGDIAKTLCRHYRAEIVINSPALDSQCYYGSFNTATQDINDVLSSLSKVGYFDYTLTGRKALIYPKKNPVRKKP